MPVDRFDPEQPWQWATAWVEAVCVYGSREDGSEDAPESVWCLTHPKLQGRLIDQLARDFGDLDDLIDNMLPQYHDEWDDFAPSMMSELRAMVPGVYYGAVLYPRTEIISDGPGRLTIPYAIGVAPARSDKPAFGVTIERAGPGWRVTEVKPDVELPSPRSVTMGSLSRGTVTRTGKWRRAE